MAYFIDEAAQGFGLKIQVIGGENIGDHKLVYLGSDRRCYLSDANISSTMPAIGMSCGPIGEGELGEILFLGMISYSNWNWEIGKKLYVSGNTDGELTQTAPSNPLNIIQEIGCAESATRIFFHPKQVIGSIGATYTKTEQIEADELGKPAANNPTVVDQGNVTLYSFAVNTDFMTYKMPVPSDYATGGLKFQAIWTNDGDTDDQNKNIRVQFDYQVSSEGEPISGSHGNSPKNVNDAYTSATGWIDCRTDYVTIEDGDFSADDCIFLKVSFVTAPATVLTCNPHLVGICIQYTAYAGSHP